MRRSRLSVSAASGADAGSSCLSPYNDPLFLQFKEAVPSVFEPLRQERLHPSGRARVTRQRLMQPASNIFLGWVTAELSGRQFYVRQFRDAKIKPLVEAFDAEFSRLRHGLRLGPGACPRCIGRR